MDKLRRDVAMNNLKDFLRSADEENVLPPKFHKLQEML